MARGREAGAGLHGLDDVCSSRRVRRADGRVARTGGARMDGAYGKWVQGAGEVRGGERAARVVGVREAEAVRADGRPARMGERVGGCVCVDERSLFAGSLV